MSSKSRQIANSTRSRIALGAQFTEEYNPEEVYNQIKNTLTGLTNALAGFASQGTGGRAISDIRNLNLIDNNVRMRFITSNPVTLSQLYTQYAEIRRFIQQPNRDAMRGSLGSDIVVKLYVVEDKSERTTDEKDGTPSEKQKKTPLDKTLTWLTFGMYGKNDMYIPENGKEVAISEILTDTVCINKGLADMYGVKIGETVQISVNGTCKSFEVANIIENAKTACVYCGAWDLAQFLGYENGSYNGLWSMEQIDIDGLAESRLQRVERLERDAVSNKISAVINQATGVLIGVILLFLALFINFQDNQRDMDILRLIGYQNKEIRRLFVDVYLPIVVFFFLISAFPSILLAKAIQKGLSLSIQDYLPFGINIKVFVVMFIMMGLLYGCVWGSFVRKLRKYDEGV